MSTPSSSRVPLLDGLRGIAALTVVVFHESGLYGSHGFFSYNFLAVDFFFLLSGFVLARAFEPRFAQGLSVIPFMSMRLKRLYPLMALGAVLGAICTTLILGPAGIGWMLVLTLLFIPQFGAHPAVFFLNGPQWSLMFELMANMAHALGLARLSKRALLLVCAICALLMLRAALHYGTLDLGWQQTGIWVGLVRTAYSYGLGMLLARTLEPGQTSSRLLWFLPMAMLPLMMAMITTLPFLPGLLVSWAVIVAGFPAILVVALRCAPPTRMVPLLDWLGRISFPLYAIHLPLVNFGSWLTWACPEWGIAPRILGFALALGGAALLAETRLAGPARKSARTGQAQALAA